MNLQARKLILIEEFLRINDENFITKLEFFIKKEKKIFRERNLKPMSVKEFHEIIDESIKESKNGKVISHQDLKKKIKTWK
jgi:hypothetical protein